MLWTLSPDLTLRYILLFCVESLAKHSTYIDIVIDYMYKIRYTNERCSQEITELYIRPSSYSFTSTVPVPLSSPFLSPMLTGILPGIHQGANTLERRQCKCECVEFLNMQWTWVYIQVLSQNETYLSWSRVKGGLVGPHSLLTVRRFWVWCSGPSVSSLCVVPVPVWDFSRFPVTAGQPHWCG